MPADRTANLIPIRDSETARKLGSVGGRKRAENARLRKSLRERLQLMLEAKSGNMDAADMITMAIIERALSGDVRAFEVIRDTIGEKPSDKAEIKAGETMRIIWKE